MEVAIMCKSCLPQERQQILSSSQEPGTYTVAVALAPTNSSTKYGSFRYPHSRGRKSIKARPQDLDIRATELAIERWSQLAVLRTMNGPAPLATGSKALFWVSPPPPLYPLK